jgi:hypothetical protein
MQIWQLSLLLADSAAKEALEALLSVMATRRAATVARAELAVSAERSNSARKLAS